MLVVGIHVCFVAKCENLGLDFNFTEMRKVKPDRWPIGCCDDTLVQLPFTLSHLFNEDVVSAQAIENVNYRIE